ncbi:MAG: rhomboid family intramembrane serine protease [Bacteroidota bacterium]|nr:rhomboid family intramembrane serine protease [Bacteroidota bacterium]MDP3146611.1 rhomboid family intramembrane serine protease [Bacteroidota bacterium]MDP3556184.1 rhomboid family intramembrane serine protease [Bacteroidota bacterium]
MNFFQKIKYNFQIQGILTKIIIVNVAIFLTVNLVGNLSHLPLLNYLALPLGGDKFLYKFWTIFTYMFTHENLGHIFWNMVLFYFTAQIFFTILGQKKMLYVYVMSGISGGALVLILALLFPASFGNSLLLGASAAVLGVGAVMAIYSPNYTVYLFGVLELSYKYFYLIVFGVSTIIDLSVNTGGKLSHVGGALFGVLYGYNLKKGVDVFNINIFNTRKKKLKIVSNNSGNKGFSGKQSDSEQTMNEILDKISKSGYDSLTKREKDELFKLSQKK